VGDQVSHSYQTTGSVRVVCVSDLVFLGVMAHIRHLVLSASDKTHKKVDIDINHPEL
jgi:hypothetical protein